MIEPIVGGMLGGALFAALLVVVAEIDIRMARRRRTRVPAAGRDWQAKNRCQVRGCHCGE